jgi:hypothetical protein
MRKLLFVVAGAGLLVAVLAPTVAGDSNNKFEAQLNGFAETPTLSVDGRGTFKATIHSDRITYTLSYRRLTGGATQAHIHLGRTAIAGSVSAFLCGGSTKPACPAGISGTVTGTIIPTDVIGPNGQGIAPGQFDELVRAIRNRATYANVHTAAWPLGEIRGQLERD